MIAGLRDRNSFAHLVTHADERSDFDFVVERREGANCGCSEDGGFNWPHGRRTAVPLTTMVEARPWYPMGTHL